MGTGAEWLQAEKFQPWELMLAGVTGSVLWISKAVLQDVLKISGWDSAAYLTRKYLVVLLISSDSISNSQSFGHPRGAQ